MRRAARIDDNHAEVVKALRIVGASVQSLAPCGAGVPDILAGFRGMNFLLEVKDGAKSASQRKLTADQEEWHAAWRGNATVVFCVTDALRAIGAVGD